MVMVLAGVVWRGAETADSRIRRRAVQQDGWNGSGRAEWLSPSSSEDGSVVTRGPGAMSRDCRRDGYASLAGSHLAGTEERFEGLTWGCPFGTLPDDLA